MINLSFGLRTICSAHTTSLIFDTKTATGLGKEIERERERSVKRKRGSEDERRKSERKRENAIRKLCAMMDRTRRKSYLLLSTSIPYHLPANIVRFRMQLLTAEMCRCHARFRFSRMHRCIRVCTPRKSARRDDTRTDL